VCPCADNLPSNDDPKRSFKTCPMTQITTVIFDMYETLVQENHDQWRETFKDIIRQQNLNVDAELLWQTWWGLERKFRDTRASPGAVFKTYYQAWREAFAGAFDTLNLSGDPGAAIDKSMQDLSQRQPFEETRTALRMIQPRCRTAILSNADECYFRPNLMLLDEDIVAGLSAVLTSEEAQCYKPHPAFFEEMLRRLGAAPQECLYVGDRQLEDVQGPGGVGMVTAWINRSRSERDPQLTAPDYEINSLLEIPEILDRISGKKDGG
jgi:2-haloalkanoic acid dehalogenase type II